MMNPLNALATATRAPIALGARAAGFGVGLTLAVGRAAREAVTGRRPAEDALADVEPTPEPFPEPSPSPVPGPFPAPEPMPGGPEPIPTPEPEPQPDPVGGPDLEPVFTPAGIEAAAPAVNPDTTESDLHQPGTEDLVEPATAKAIRSEAAMMRRAAQG